MNKKPQTLEVCFTDFNRRFPLKRGDISAEQRLLCDFIKCDFNNTIRKWMLNIRHPAGENKFRSIAFFQLIGYKVSEFEEVRPLYQQAILLLALDVVPLNDLANDGFQMEGKRVADKLYRTLAQNNNILPTKVPVLSAYIKKYTEDLGAATDLFQEKYGSLALSENLVAVAMPAKESPPVPVVAKATPLVTHSTVIETIVHMMKGLLPLATIAASDTFSPEERAHLRELMGGDGIFRLSNVFDKLCGERARTKN